MKKILMSFLSAICFGTFTMAQDNQSGVYLTLKDFENDKLSYLTKHGPGTTTIRFNEFLGNPFISIKQNGEKIKLYKDDIYAYRNRGKIVRTVDLVSYTLSENGMIWIYYKDMNISQGKGVKRANSKTMSAESKDL